MLTENPENPDFPGFYFVSAGFRLYKVHFNKTEKSESDPLTHSAPNRHSSYTPDEARASTGE
ncbi:hypothetical protein HMPREF9374_0967 [Desmospora sp. 8437]|nr:hypothetical protein HMPREF9374_0967 [Desmospora sp. 8437]